MQAKAATKWLAGMLSFALAAATPADAVAPVDAAARAAWGFDRSDLTPHPGVRFGVLANGMRYAIMKNSVPSGALSVRLRLDAGAKLEGKREEGHLHLIEHLLFQGTPNIPQGSLPLMLAHRGLRHWSDVNAFTSFDETVYRIDMTRSDLAARNAALLVMREVASNLLFTRSTVAGAKRDVVAEIAARNAVEDTILSAQNAFFVPGTAIDRGPVAGSRSAVKRATPETLRKLYERLYAPERATLILVGDFDPALVEAEVGSRFSDWAATGQSPAPHEVPFVRLGRGTEARLFVASAAPTTVTIAALRPLGPEGDQGGRRDAHFLEHLGAQMLSRRLARLAGTANAPFGSADAAIYVHYATARLARIEAEAMARDWTSALKTAARELRTVLNQGFTQAELDEQIAGSRRALTRDALPPSTPTLADALIDAVNRSIVFTEPADPQGTDAYLSKVRLGDVNAAFRAVWQRSGPLIFVSHDRKVPGGEAAVLAAWREAAGAP